MIIFAIYFLTQKFGALLWHFFLFHNKSLRKALLAYLSLHDARMRLAVPDVVLIPGRGRVRAPVPSFPRFNTPSRQTTVPLNSNIVLVCNGFSLVANFTCVFRHCTTCVVSMYMLRLFILICAMILQTKHSKGPSHVMFHEIKYVIVLSGGEGFDSKPVVEVNRYCPRVVRRHSISVFSARNSIIPYNPNCKFSQRKLYSSHIICTNISGENFPQSYLTKMHRVRASGGRRGPWPAGPDHEPMADRRVPDAIGRLILFVEGWQTVIANYVWCVFCFLFVSRNEEIVLVLGY